MGTVQKASQWAVVAVIDVTSMAQCWCLNDYTQQSLLLCFSSYGVVSAVTIVFETPAFHQATVHNHFAGSLRCEGQPGSLHLGWES